jgi:hypothetical protein
MGERERAEEPKPTSDWTLWPTAASATASNSAARAPGGRDGMPSASARDSADRTMRVTTGVGWGLTSDGVSHGVSVAGDWIDGKRQAHWRTAGRRWLQGAPWAAVSGSWALYVLSQPLSSSGLSLGGYRRVVWRWCWWWQKWA